MILTIQESLLYFFSSACNVGSKNPMKTHFSPCKKSKESARGFITSTYSLTKSTSSGSSRRRKQKSKIKMKFIEALIYF